jgi:hypothetical protein
VGADAKYLPFGEFNFDQFGRDERPCRCRLQVATAFPEFDANWSVAQSEPESVSVGSCGGDVDFQSQRSIILGSPLAGPTPEVQMQDTPEPPKQATKQQAPASSLVPSIIVGLVIVAVAGL